MWCRCSGFPEEKDPLLGRETYRTIVGLHGHSDTNELGSDAILIAPALKRLDRREKGERETAFVERMRCRH